MPETDIAARLTASAARALGGRPEVRDPRRLSGGASQESWRFTLVRDGAEEDLVLRRAPDGKARAAAAFVDLPTEAALLRAAADRGVPVPELRWTLTGDDGLGPGYVMRAVEGETLPKKILHDPEFADVRPRLARQCGGILARLHATPASALPELPPLDAAAQLEQLRTLYDGFGERRPVLELAFRWLADRAPPCGNPTLVHGDFRNGNLMIGPDGIRAVLDWELAHSGDPMEDLGWLCVPSWRFGEIDRPVGGFGEREDLFAGYAAESGAAVDPGEVRYWEVFGVLRWGVICLIQAFTHLSGRHRSMELAAVGRRVSETEIDLLQLLHPRERLAAPDSERRPPGPRPNVRELTAAVAEWLREEARPALSGRHGYHARVAANVLDVVERELVLGPELQAAETERLRELLDRDGTREELNAQLCAAIANGTLTPENAPALVEHLWATTAGNLAVDQPDYATYRRLLQGDRP